MDHRKFLGVDLMGWVYGTVEKAGRGDPWSSAWTSTYWEIGGCSEWTAKKGCPMAAARTLYEYGRIRDGGKPFENCDIKRLWEQSRNGTYAMLALRLLGTDPTLNKAGLWRRIQEAVRCEMGAEPAASNQGAPTLAFQLWHLGLIVEETG